MDAHSGRSNRVDVSRVYQKEVVGRLERRIRPWIVPTIASLAFGLLLTHKSEFQVVFSRYSIDYAILLVLSAVNLGLLWLTSIRRVSYRQFITRGVGNALVSLVVLALLAVVLSDLVLARPPRLRVWVNLGLVGVLLIQLEALRQQPILVARRVALLAGSLAVTVILVEAIFALVLLQSQSPTNQSEFLQLMASRRLWPRPISVMKPEGTFRIVGLSDSFGTARGPSNHHYLVETALRGDGYPTIEMINVSVPGYGPRDELAMLRFAMAYSPDLVLHGFFAGNDFTLQMVEGYAYLDIYAKRPPGDSWYRPRSLLVRSWVVSALELYGEERRRRDEERSGIVKEVGVFSKKTHLEIEYARMTHWAKPTEEDVERMKSVFPVLDAIRSVAEQGGARYVMVMHPDEVQVNEDLRREIIKTFQADENQYDFGLPQKLLGAYCAGRGVPLLDLLPLFRAKGRGSALYSLRDTHYSDAGNELAAASISEFLRRLLGDSARRAGQV